MNLGLPKAQGLYDPANEHDNCGIGFVAHIKGQKSHDIIERGLEVLENMDHRGATSADNKTGDGAGILMQIPDQYIKEVLKVNIPASGKFGTGLIFLPQDRKEATLCQDVLTKFIKQEGLEIIEYRDVAVDSSAPGEIAKLTEPYVRQVFIKADLEQDVLEQKLYLARKQAEKEIRESLSVIPEIKGLHHIRSRGTEQNLFIDMHVLADKEMLLMNVHELAHRIEKNLQAHYQPSKVQVITHMEPFVENYKKK